jgi:hypothetical protein
VALIAEWSDDLLAVELAELKALDIDLGGLGFTDVEISKLLEPGLEVGATDPDDIPAPPDEAITQPGDLWILGNHRLLCGDSGSVADLDRLLDGAVIHLCNTDPPYNVKVEPRSQQRDRGGVSHRSARRSRRDAARASRRTTRSSMSSAIPARPRGRTKQMRAKDRPLANDFVSDEEFDRHARRVVRQHRARPDARRRVLHLGRLRQPAATTHQLLKKHGLYFSASDHLAQDASGADAQGLHGRLRVVRSTDGRKGAAHRYFGPNNDP